MEARKQSKAFGKGDYQKEANREIYWITIATASAHSLEAVPSE
jgi:hypothetical protein